MTNRLVVLVLDPPLALAVHEAATAACASLAAEQIALRLGAGVVLANTATDAEEDAGQEVADEGRPRETVGVRAERCALVVVAEGVTALDGPCTI